MYSRERHVRMIAVISSMIDGLNQILDEMEQSAQEDRALEAAFDKHDADKDVHFHDTHEQKYDEPAQGKVY